MVSPRRFTVLIAMQYESLFILLVYDSDVYSWNIAS